MNWLAGPPAVTWLGVGPLAAVICKGGPAPMSEGGGSALLEQIARLRESHPQNLALSSFELSYEAALPLSLPYESLQHSPIQITASLPPIQIIATLSIITIHCQPLHCLRYTCTATLPYGRVALI